MKEVVLQAPTVSAWLANQLPVSRAMYYASKLKVGKGQPRIWMLTGVQYLTDAEVTSGNKSSSSATVSASVPPPEPLAAAISLLSGQSLLNLGGEVEKSSETGAGYHHSDERIWAAQFTPLDVQFHPANKADEVRLESRVNLGPLPDLKSAGLRYDKQAEIKGKQQEEIAEVKGLDETDRSRWDEDASSILSRVPGIALQHFPYIASRRHVG